MNNIYLDEIHIRDPYILVDNGKYYMYGTRGHECAGLCTGIDVYVSKDLKTWTEAHEVFTKPEDFWADRDFWAPEVHKYMGKYYMFVSFKSESRCRGTQILASDSPLGPFEIHSEGPVTPSEWECLDGTLYIDKNSVPYMVFCHEWVQVDEGNSFTITNGAKSLVKSLSGKIILSDDISHTNTIQLGTIDGKWHTVRQHFYKTVTPDGTTPASVISDFYFDGEKIVDNSAIYSSERPQSKDGGFVTFNGKLYVDNLHLDFEGAPASVVNPYGELDGVRISNGNTTVNGTDYTYSFTATKDTKTTETMEIYLAVFDNEGRLQGVSIQNVDLKWGIWNYNVSAQFDSGYTLKAFVWNFDTLVPLYAAL